MNINATCFYRLRLFLILLMIWMTIGISPVPSMVAAPNLPMAQSSITVDDGKIAIGESHACAITKARTVKCWGSNAYGQLGYPNYLASITTPVSVVGFRNDIISVSAGRNHTCALTAGGAVFCWGSNQYGKLGDGTQTDSSVPVSVFGLSSGVIAISAGYHYTCAILNTGAAKCWGFNSSGELGNAGISQTNIPVDVVGLNVGAIKISTHSNHTCVITVNGGVKCWGRGAFESMGGNLSHSVINTPADISGLTSGMIDVAVGDFHTCALSDAGAVLCWGDNHYGQLGDGTSDSTRFYSEPSIVYGLYNNVLSISSHSMHTCAITNVGAVKCWGYNNRGQTGDGLPGGTLRPVTVSGLSNEVVSIAAGGSNSCVFTNQGVLKCWGSNESGLVGAIGATQTAAPANIVWSNDEIAAISMSNSHACLLTDIGRAKCWGNNTYGQLGNNSNEPSGVSVDVAGLNTEVIAIDAGQHHTCAVMNVGTVKCWGQNSAGQLGNDNTIDTNSPITVSGLLTNMVGVATGSHHSCALGRDGKVRCWGENGAGQLGINTTLSSTVPVDINNLTDVTSISAGGNHTCAIADRYVKCWGLNDSGQIGNNSTANALAPVVIVGAEAVSAGKAHTCALFMNETVKCWGNNSFGQLGDNTTTHSAIPVYVSGLGTVKSVSAGDNHTCALLITGGVKCWGDNLKGQLGISNTNQALTPVDVDGLSSGVLAISAGGDSTCAILNTHPNTVKCWGSNEYGQLGEGTTATATPTPTATFTPTPTHTPTPTPTSSATPFAAPPLPVSCSGGDTPIAYDNDVCCVSGYVYMDGQVVSGASVTLTYQSHSVVVSTSASAGSNVAFFSSRLDLPPLTVPIGGIVTLTASANGQQSQPQTFVARAGGQQVDAAIPSLSNQPPIATINKITPYDARQSIDTFYFYGSGVDPDVTNSISEYRWSRMDGGSNPVISSQASFTLAASALAVGTHTLRFEVKDDEGQWSAPITRTVLVRSANGNTLTDNSYLLMIYASADNNLSPYMGDYPGAMLSRLRRAGPAANVRVVVQYDGHRLRDSYRYVLNPDGTWATQAIDEVEMDRPETLNEFIVWARQSYPAEHYVLAIADHANGVVGIAQDDNSRSESNTRPFLTPIELRTALQWATGDGERKLDIVLFDGCSFGLFEDTAVVDGYAHFMIASPNTGWGVFAYETYRQLASNPNTATSPQALALQIAAAYAQKVAAIGKPYTISVYDMAGFNLSKLAISQFGDALVNYIAASPAARIEQIRSLRNIAQKYDSVSGTPFAPDTEDNYVDIVDFARLVYSQINDETLRASAMAVTQTLLSPVQPFILSAAHASGVIPPGDVLAATGGSAIVVNLSNASGLGIFYPPRNTVTSNSALENYLTNKLFHITHNWGWTRFLLNGNAPALGASPEPMPGNVLISPLLPCGDIYEPNDNAASATAITVGSTFTNTAFCVPSDVDWFVFTATVGTRYRIETFNLAADNDTVLDLYAADAITALASDDNGNTATSVGASRLIRTLGAGRHYVRVSHVISDAGNPALTYQLRVSIERSPTNAFVPNARRGVAAGW